MAKFKETKFFKRIDNFWYHYKWIVVIVSVFVIFFGVSTVQLLTKTSYDIYVMYAGPQVVSLQNAVYIETAFEKLDDNDRNNDGKIEACLRDLTIMSPDDLNSSVDEANSEEVPNEGLIMNEQIVGAQMSGSLKTFDQEIFGGDSVICLLSPYMYARLPMTDGVSDAFMNIDEVLGYTPDGKYDDYAVYLKSTDFGKYAPGVSSLPDDTLLCIRRVSSMSFLKGQEKTEKAHAYHVGKFRAIFEYEWENSENDVIIP